jgi:PD-(D/E)XK nuclease superfamily
MSDDPNMVQAESVLSVIDFFSTTTGLIDQANRPYRERLSPDFNVFDFVAPDELELSRILAWLLDEKGSHEQGQIFQQLFFDQIGVPAEVRPHGGAVYTEFPVPGGRLDIFVRSAHLCIAIENKPWASDQVGQIQTYSRWLAREKVPYKLVYMTSDGRPPSATSIPEEELHALRERDSLSLVGYRREIRDWLSRCRASCKSDRVSAFIAELIAYIDHTFGGETDQTMKNHLLDEIIALPERVAATMQTALLADSLRQKLLELLGRQVTEQLPGHRVEVSANVWERYSGLRIGFSDDSDYVFSLEFQNSQFNGLVYGIQRRREHSPVQNKEDKAVQNEIGSGKSNSWWLWYREARSDDGILPVLASWGTEAAPWADISSGQLARRIVGVFQRMQTALSRASVPLSSVDKPEPNSD